MAARPDLRGFVPGRHLIDAYGAGGFRFAEMSHRGSILALPSGVKAWEVTSPAEFSLDAFAPVLAEAAEIDVLLVGTGREAAALPEALRRRFKDAGHRRSMRCRPGRRRADLQHPRGREPQGRGGRSAGGASASPDTRARSFVLPHCETLVREGDRDRYFATLFAPADKRPFLFALYAFSLESARVRESVSDPMPGEIRLQWWRDALQGEARGNVRANPVAAALDDTIVRFRLPRQALVDLVDARELRPLRRPDADHRRSRGLCRRDLLGADPARRHRPERWRRSRRGGCGRARRRRLRHRRASCAPFPWHARRGQVYPAGPGLQPARGVARRRRARTGRTGLSGGARGAARDRTRPSAPRASPARDDCRRKFCRPSCRPPWSSLTSPGWSERGYDPFRTVVELPQWRRQLMLWRAARAGRF